MARAIAADLAPRKIRVNVVAPGATKTPIWNRGPRASVSAEQSAKLVDLYASTIPPGRWGEPEDLDRREIATFVADVGRVMRGTRE